MLERTQMIRVLKGMVSKVALASILMTASISVTLSQDYFSSRCAQCNLQGVSLTDLDRAAKNILRIFDANKDRRLQLNELESATNALFVKIDSDSNGLWEEGELMHWIASTETRQIAEAIDIANFDALPNIGPQEFELLLSASTAVTLQLIYNLGLRDLHLAQMSHRLTSEEIMVMLDTNKDASLSEEELGRMRQVLDLHAYMKLDSNQNGSVEAQEYYAYVRNIFQYLDINSSKELSVVEFTRRYESRSRQSRRNKR